MMLEINKQIALKTNDKLKQLVLDCLYLVEHHFTFHLYVASGSFQGVSSFCTSKNEIEQLIKSLDQMYTSLIGSAELVDNDSDSFVNFQIKGKNGHLIVKGQVGGSHEDHYMKFEFITDQTVMPHFIDDLKDLLLV